MWETYHTMAGIPDSLLLSTGVTWLLAQVLGGLSQREIQRAGKGTDKVGRGSVSVKFLRAVGGGRIIMDFGRQVRERADSSQ
jgi:hypothetical protein